MAIERIGTFIEVVDEDGLRNLVRITAIQRVCDVDEMRQESYLTVAGRMILIRASLDEFRAVLMDQTAARTKGGTLAPAFDAIMALPEDMIDAIRNNDET